MAFQNFGGDDTQEIWARKMLSDGEQLTAIVDTDNRFISVTNSRLILNEKDGNYSIIRIQQISAIEVSDGKGDEKFVKIYFGGGLSRMLSAPNEVQAAAIASGGAGV
jgi:hypothetical protein